MHNDDSTVDLSIELLPINEPFARPKPRRRPIFYLLVIGGVFLSITALLAIVAMVIKFADGRNRVVAVTAQQDHGLLREEAVRTFGKYDAANERNLVLSQADQTDRDEIAKLIEHIEACVAKENNEEYRTLVDFDRLLKRIELTGNVRGWSTFEKKVARTKLKENAHPEPFWAKLIIAGVVTPQDDPNSRVVYAYGWTANSSEQTEHRFWVCRDAGSWKLYDWERLDLGLSKSTEIGLCAKYIKSPEMAGLQRWNDLLVEADNLTTSGDHSAAKEKIREAESQLAPSEFEGYRWVLTGHRWLAIDDSTEAERCYLHVPDPENTPGAYFGLLSCHRDRNPTEALKDADRYAAAIGPNPDLLAIKAQLLAGLGRKTEATQAWKQLLRIQPTNTTALKELFFSLPKDNRPGFEQQLEQTKDTVATVVSIAPSIGYRDYDGLLYLVEYLKRKAPTAPGTLYLRAFAQQLDGQYGAAATLYRQAYDAESSEEKRSSYIYQYVEAMAANGQVVEAWKSLPDPKAAFESFLASYDEGDVELADDEYRQLIDLHRQQFPSDLAGMEREVSLVLSQKRYADAERLAKQALQQAEANAAGEHSEASRKSLSSSLAAALYRQGRLKDAYDTPGDRRQRFSNLTNLTIADKHWNDLRSLVEMHRAQDAEDPQLHYAEGELAAQAKQWDDAIRLIQQALQAMPEDENWLVKRRLSDVYIDSGRWPEYLKSSADHGQAFDELANRFIFDENWSSVESLIAEYKKLEPTDNRIARRSADAAWARKEYFTYIQCAQELLPGTGPKAVANYERNTIEDRLLSALLRGKQFNDAFMFAQDKQREKNDVSKLAIVNAAAGKLDEAKRWAKVTAAIPESASEFYENDDVGPIFIGPEFSDLQADYPINFPHDAAPTLAVFLFAEPWHLEAAEITAAMNKLGIKPTGELQPIKALGKSVTSAFALPVGESRMWVAAGEGRFNNHWDLDNDKSPLVESIKKSRGWLAVGTAGWTEPDRERAEQLARRLFGQLIVGRDAVICVRTHEHWAGLTAYLATPEIIFAWQSSGNLKPFKDDGHPLDEKWNSEVEANRQFDRSLREAVRSFEAVPGARLEVSACTSLNPSIDPVPLEVKTARRSYGNLEFDGTLQAPSVLLPQLRAGLSMQFPEARVQSFRLNDQPLIVRPAYR